MKTALRVLALALSGTSALSAQSQHPPTRFDSTAVIAVTLRAGARDLFSRGRPRLVSDRIGSGSRTDSPAFLAKPAAEIGARLVHHSDVVKCTEPTSNGCVLVGNTEVLYLNEIIFHGDTANVEVALLTASKDPHKITMRSRHYLLMRRAGTWSVTGTKGATFS